MLKKLQQQEKKAPLDYKEPYEFRLLIGDNIICQRYFRINNFNNLSLNSLELTDTIRRCAEMIDNDLKSKTRVYSWRMAPLVFDNKEQMQKWFNNPKNSSGVRFYETIILRDEVESEYVWDGEQLIPCEKKVYDSTFTSALEEKDILNYELAFYVNERKVVSTCFEGVYPYYIRRNIDLSNTRGKFEGEDLSKLNFESYLLNRLVNDKQDLIKTIVKELCTVCSYQDNEDYTLFESFRKSNNETVTYNLNFNDPKIINAKYAKEIAKAKRYLYGNNYNKSK